MYLTEKFISNVQDFLSTNWDYFSQKNTITENTDAPIACF